VGRLSDYSGAALGNSFGNSCSGDRLLEMLVEQGCCGLVGALHAGGKLWPGAPGSPGGL
jgi:hypothetical protein